MKLLTIKDVATYIATLGIVDTQHVYCGKMANKPGQCVGVYNLSRGSFIEPYDASFRVKQVSLLVHWNKATEGTETATQTLYEALKSASNVTVNSKKIKFITPKEPVDVGTDNSGVYEMVIEADIYYER